jgi:hypothetical protein
VLVTTGELQRIAIERREHDKTNSGTKRLAMWGIGEHNTW